ENGARLIVFKIRYKRKRNLLKCMMIDGLEIVGEAALVAYTFKSNFHPAWPLVVSAMGAVSATDFYRNARRVSTFQNLYTKLCKPKVMNVYVTINVNNR
ncbi:hypothetical protein AVEN_114023-1, partial [Araneus ventricosus]